MIIKKEEMKKKLLFNGLPKSLFTKKRTISRQKSFYEVLNKKNFLQKKKLFKTELIVEYLFTKEEKDFCLAVWG